MNEVKYYFFIFTTLLWAGPDQNPPLNKTSKKWTLIFCHFFLFYKPTPYVLYLVQIVINSQKYEIVLLHTKAAYSKSNFMLLPMRIPTT